MGPTRQEWPQEATTRSHLGDRAQGRARALRAHLRREADARAPPAARRSHCLDYQIIYFENILCFILLIIL